MNNKGMEYETFMSNVLFGMGFAGSFIVDLWLVSMFQFLIGSEPMNKQVLKSKTEQKGGTNQIED